MRSIPACAGEPRCARHPPGPQYWRRPGLSPRVRGNHEIAPLYPLTTRSIPACAGEPAAGRTCSLWTRVYPRVCGGTIGGAKSGVHSAGLSPRVRGNPHAWRRPPGPPRSIPRVRGNLGHKAGLTAGLRSIPACAGEPAVEVDGGAQGRVYPRVCGGTLPRQVSHLSRPGLSPRVRGNPRDSDDRKCPSWSIPACAGEPLSSYP